ncbi:MAG: hypothetical protein K0S32_1494 [Bacteroidetes bacterium]|jgi:hypothetical protein|nr:hypothetical protein [Bacteroidota bacterium]
MLTHPDNFFHSLQEPYRSCLLFLQKFIREQHDGISEEWHFNTPFYYYNKKWLGFISYHPKTKEIYISFTDGHLMKHKSLKSEGRKKARIFRVDPEKDIDVKALKEILKKACQLKE